MASSRDPRPGDILANRYLLGAELARGGMGAVFAATDLRTGGRVAVKLVHPHLAANPAYTARLRREAQLAAALTSPRVVRIIDLATDPTTGVAFLVQEFVAGETLGRRLEAQVTFPPAEALALAREVTLALAAAHAAGIVHRDLKPSNIMLVEGQVKVLDFGIARGVGDARVTATGTYLGTPAYSAPELADGMGDVRSDIYALGVILYELLAGTVPFDAPTPLAVLRLHTDAPPPPLPEDVPAAVRAVVARCLAKDPADRYQTPGELLADIDRALRPPQDMTADPRAMPATLTVPRMRPLAQSARAAPTQSVAFTPSPAPVPAPAMPSPAHPMAPEGHGASPHNLPVALTSFIGRERERAEVRHQLGATRLLTLSGPGGVGKTRLALEVAGELRWAYRDGVWLVELAALTDPALVPQAVATALAIREQPPQPLRQTLLTALQARALLLVLDNCEHLVDACARLAEAILRAAPHVQILATSREPLGLAGESVWAVPSLALPRVTQASTSGSGDPTALLEFDAVRLFTTRAAASHSAFALTAANAAATVEICRRLDGIPLALELAAARVKVLTVDQIVTRLQDRFRLLTGGSRTALARHQTLRAAIDWSYDLLTPPERALFERLSVFAGGASLDAVEAVCVDGDVPEEVALDLLTELVDKSLLLVDQSSGEARYTMLETIRQYGEERLGAAGQRHALRSRQQAFYLALAERAEPELTGPDQGRWLERLELEHDNLRAVLGWNTGEGRDAEAGARLAGALWRFWMVHGHFTEGSGWLERALAGDEAGERAIRAKGHNGAGALTFQLGQYDQARAHFAAGLALRRELGDTAGIAFTLNSLGNVAWAQGDYEQARAWYEESLQLRRALGDQGGVASTLNNLGTLASDMGEYATARARHEESLAIRRLLRTSNTIAQSLYNLGEVAIRSGAYQEAGERLGESLRLAQRLGDMFVLTSCLGAYARIAAAHGRFVEAARLFGADERLREAIHVPLGLTHRATYEHSIEMVRSHLGEGAFHAAWQAGRQLAQDEAVAEALAIGEDG